MLEICLRNVGLSIGIYVMFDNISERIVFYRLSTLESICGISTA